MGEELIRLLRSYNKQTTINVIKNRNGGPPLLGLAKYIYIYYCMYKKTAKYLTFWTILNFCFLDFLDIFQARSNKNLIFVV